MKTVLKKIDVTTGQCVEFQVLKGCGGAIRGYKLSHTFLDRSVYRFNKCDDADIVYVYVRKNSKYQWHMVYDWGFIDLTEEAPTEEAPTEEAPTEEAPTEEAPTFIVRYFNHFEWVTLRKNKNSSICRFPSLSSAFKAVELLCDNGLKCRVYKGISYNIKALVMCYNPRDQNKK